MEDIREQEGVGHHEAANAEAGRDRLSVSQPWPDTHIPGCTWGQWAKSQKPS